MYSAFGNDLSELECQNPFAAEVAEKTHRVGVSSDRPFQSAVFFERYIGNYFDEVSELSTRLRASVSWSGVMRDSSSATFTCAWSAPLCCAWAYQK